MSRRLNQDGFVEISNQDSYGISEDDVLAHARMLGYRLGEDELDRVNKGIDCGLSFDLDTVLTAAITEVVENR